MNHLFSSQGATCKAKSSHCIHGTLRSTDLFFRFAGKSEPLSLFYIPANKQSNNLILQQYSWPLCERPNKSRVQGHATREYPSTNPILLAYSIWQLEATPERSFCFFQPLEKAKIHAHYIVQMKNRTEPNRFVYYFSTNRTEPNREPKINQFLENEPEPNRPHPEIIYIG